MANYLYSNRSKLKILAKTGLIVDFCTILQNPISVLWWLCKRPEDLLSSVQSVITECSLYICLMQKGRVTQLQYMVKCNSPGTFFFFNFK